MILTVRKKPVIVQAVQWTGENWDELVEWCPYGLFLGTRRQGLTIDTLEGEMRADIGDYVIKGVNGEYYPCKPDIFKKSYEIVTEGR